MGRIRARLTSTGPQTSTAASATTQRRPAAVEARPRPRGAPTVEQGLPGGTAPEWLWSRHRRAAPGRPIRRGPRRWPDRGSGPDAGMPAGRAGRRPATPGAARLRCRQDRPRWRHATDNAPRRHRPDGQEYGRHRGGAGLVGRDRRPVESVAGLSGRLPI